MRQIDPRDIIEYKLIADSKVSDFNKRVNETLSDGYIVYGELKLGTSSSGSLNRNQVFVKLKDKPKVRPK